MARRPPTQKLDEIERVLQAHPDGMSAPEIAQALSESRSDRTLQNHLRRLVKDGRVLRLSSGRWTRYRTRPAADAGAAEGPTIPLSDRAAEILRLVRRPVSEREPVGYSRQFLEGYRPNQTSYLTAVQRSQLARVTTRPSDAAELAWHVLLRAAGERVQPSRRPGRAGKLRRATPAGSPEGDAMAAAGACDPIACHGGLGAPWRWRKE